MCIDNDFDKFRNREIRAKDIFDIVSITKPMAYDFVRKYHYLGDAKFFCVYAFGLFYKKTHELVGCATFSLPQGIDALKGWFSLDNSTKNIFELSRLCMLPELNGTNATSFLLGSSLKELNKMNKRERERCKRLGIPFTPDRWVCRACITLAMAERHVGSIYQVCNFKCFGMTDLKVDFYRDDGVKNPRGKVSQWHGVYLPRPRKYRYAYIFDNSLHCNYEQEDRPSIQDKLEKASCCNGTHEVYDSRYDEWYTCPICTGKLLKIHKDDSGNTISIENNKKEENKYNVVSLW